MQTALHIFGAHRTGWCPPWCGSRSLASGRLSMFVKMRASGTSMAMKHANRSKKRTLTFGAPIDVCDLMNPTSPGREPPRGGGEREVISGTWNFGLWVAKTCEHAAAKRHPKEKKEKSLEVTTRLVSTSNLGHSNSKPSWSTRGSLHVVVVCRGRRNTHLTKPSRSGGWILFWCGRKGVDQADLVNM